MARMPGATQRPIPVNYTRGGQESVYGVVIHIMDGSYAGTDSWFRNLAAEASSHFGTSRAGELCQWVDTADRAWAQAGGNRTWLSVENEGRGGDSLTDAQIDRCAEVLAWAHKTHGVPIQLADGVNGRGLGYHAMGGSSWGGHTSCPGSRVVAQLAEIVARAKNLAGGGTSPSAPSTGVARYQATINGLTYGYGAHGDHVTAVGQALVAQGCSAYTAGPGPDWSDADTLSYQKWQKKLGYTGADADGVPGEASLTKLLGKLPTAAKPQVSLAKLVTAAKADPPKAGAPVSYAGAKTVETALAAEGLLAKTYVDGHFGTTTVSAYAAWQRRLGYTGNAADGIPGKASLTKLGDKHGFTVVA
ncbi:peptidoglycan-binding protein [Streptomyces nodosus]|uniref:peptidoglycan-binding protein n=1 Tax=Streptomyces nodosus TaxID=40318 RepID=UPI00382E06B7